jgi:hypothetical protein
MAAYLVGEKREFIRKIIREVAFKGSSSRMEGLKGNINRS